MLLTSLDLSRACLYQQDQQTSTEALSLLNNLLQNPGNPVDWGTKSIMPTGFGLKEPYAEQMAPSPFVPMRLMKTSEIVVYNNSEYRNLTTESMNLFMKKNEYVLYDKAADLLAIDDTYGFRVIMTPLLNITVFQVESNPLKIGISLLSLSGTVYGAELIATLYYLKTGSPYPSISEPIILSTVSNISGGAEIEFSTINANNTLYFVLVRASLGGITGVGYYINSLSGHSPIIPLITGYDEGVISLVHRKNLTSSFSIDSDLYYNLTFITQLRATEFRTISIENSFGIVKPNEPKTITVGVGNPGVLLISSTTPSEEYGLTIMPWGIVPLSLSMDYGADPINKKTVVKKSMNVVISGLSYQAEVALWRLDVEG